MHAIHDNNGITTHGTCWMLDMLDEILPLPPN